MVKKFELQSKVDKPTSKSIGGISGNSRILGLMEFQYKAKTSAKWLLCFEAHSNLKDSKELILSWDILWGRYN